jgi:hypothetical protein
VTPRVALLILIPCALIGVVVGYCAAAIAEKIDWPRGSR